MMMINDLRGMRDLMALAREIEACESVTRRQALRLAIHQLEEFTVMDIADVRFKPAGWPIEAHVSWSVGPARSRYSGEVPHG